MGSSLDDYLKGLRRFEIEPKADGGYAVRTDASKQDNVAALKALDIVTRVRIPGLPERPLTADRVPTQEERNRLWDLYAGVSGKVGLSEEQKASLLHSHGSFRAMFARVPDGTLVAELVAAAWLGIATRTLALDLKAASG